MSEKSKKSKIDTADLRFFHENLVLSKEIIEEGLVFLIDKPLHWTSFDVVNKLKYTLKHKFNFKKLKVGHAGTLDPLASGLIIVCCGRYTKVIDQLLNEKKSYTASVKLGATTASYDGESPEENHKTISHIEDSRISEVFNEFKGEIMQAPPIYSAIKINGKNSYELARRGKDFELQSRPVFIFDLTLNDFSGDTITLHTEVSKGTYIRSLANDIGKALGVGAYLVALRRESIGEWKLSQSLPLDKVITFING